MTRHAPASTLDPDRPVPFTLTPKAHAALGQDPAGPVMYCGCGYDDCSACAGYGWACPRCGAAFFGPQPETGLCPGCLAGGGSQ